MALSRGIRVREDGDALDVREPVAAPPAPRAAVTAGLDYSYATTSPPVPAHEAPQEGTVVVPRGCDCYEQTISSVEPRRWRVEWQAFGATVWATVASSTSLRFLRDPIHRGQETTVHWRLVRQPQEASQNRSER